MLQKFSGSGSRRQRRFGRSLFAPVPGSTHRQGVALSGRRLPGHRTPATGRHHLRRSSRFPITPGRGHYCTQAPPRSVPPSKNYPNAERSAATPKVINLICPFPFPPLYPLKETETGNSLILSSETEAGSAEEQPAEGYLDEGDET